MARSPVCDVNVTTQGVEQVSLWRLTQTVSTVESATKLMCFRSQGTSDAYECARVKS